MSSFKVIDPSFNYKQTLNNSQIKFFKFLKVNIFNESLATSPFEAQIGDVIWLKRFNVKIADKGQPVAYENTYSYWCLVKENESSSDRFEVLKRKETLKQSLDFSDYEKLRI